MTSTSLQITFVFEPFRQAQPPMSIDPEFYAPFIDALGRHAGVEVSLVRDWLRRAAPPDGFILLESSDPRTVLAECAPERQANLASRIVPVGVSRVRIFETLLEPLSLPAAVDLTSISEWKERHPSDPGAWGPYGLREIGAHVGANCLLYKSERYCYLGSPTHHGLPHLLADYLRALHDVRTSESPPRHQP